MVAPDLTRTMALTTAALAVTSVPTLLPVLRGVGEQTERYDTSITPPAYAFAIWGPIFGGILANAASAQLPSQRSTADQRSTGWPLAVAYGLNTGWSIAAQTDRFRWTPVLLSGAVAATATAYRRLQAGSGPPSITSASTGLLLGWTALAATVNLSAASQLLGARATSGASVTFSAAAAGATSVGLTVTVARSRRGYLPLAVAASWGLATTALDRRRPTLSRLVAGLGASAIAMAATVRAISAMSSREESGLS